MLDGDLVPEGLAHLRDAEGDLHAHGVEAVLELDEHALRGLGAQVDGRPGEGRLDQRAQLRLRFLLVGEEGVDDLGQGVDRAQKRPEHEVERALLAQERAVEARRHVAAVRDLDIGPAVEPREHDLARLSARRRRHFLGVQDDVLVPDLDLGARRVLGLHGLGPQLGHGLVGGVHDKPAIALDLDGAGLVGPEAFLRQLAVDQRIGEAGHVPRCAPYIRMHYDRRLQAHDVLAAVNDVAPPLVHQVPLELDAQGAVVVGRLQPAINFRRLKHKPAPLAQRHDLLHQLLARLPGFFRAAHARSRGQIRTFPGAPPPGPSQAAARGPAEAPTLSDYRPARKPKLRALRGFLQTRMFMLFPRTPRRRRTPMPKSPCCLLLMGRSCLTMVAVHG